MMKIEITWNDIITFRGEVIGFKDLVMDYQFFCQKRVDRVA